MSDIETQYDRNNLHRLYEVGALAFAEKDPGRAFLREAVAHLPYNAQGVDIGCGSGMDLEALRAMGFTNLRGFDVSREFVKEARARGLDVVEGSAEQIPYEDASFDFAVSRFALMYCKDVGKTLREAARVLKPGGLLAVVVPHPQADALEQADGEGNITLTLFPGDPAEMRTPFPKHALGEYFCWAFLRAFTLEMVYEYCGKEQERGKNGLVNALCFMARKK